MGRRISSPELIGRSAEVAALSAALADVRLGHGRLVLVEGDAGIGKTRLVEEFTANLEGVRVLAGGGIPLASAAPYAALLGIFHALARLHPPAAGGLLPQHAPWQADAFALTRLFAAVSDAVRAIAAETPLVLGFRSSFSSPWVSAARSVAARQRRWLDRREAGCLAHRANA